MRIVFIILLFIFFILPCSAEEVFTISTSYQNLLSNSDNEGMLDRIYIEVFNRLDIPMQIVYTKTNKSLTDVNMGIFDAEMNRISGIELNYPNLIQIPESAMTMYFVAFAKENLTISDWESLKDYNIGIVNGWKILENNTEDLPLRILVPTENELFNMLRKDRLDIALYSKLTGYAFIKDAGYTNIKHLEPPLASRDMYLYVNRKRMELVEPIAEILREMKSDGTYDRIVNETIQKFIGEIDY